MPYKMVLPVKSVPIFRCTYHLKHRKITACFSLLVTGTYTTVDMLILGRLLPFGKMFNDSSVLVDYGDDGMIQTQR